MALHSEEFMLNSAKAMKESLALISSILRFQVSEFWSLKDGEWQCLSQFTSDKTTSLSPQLFINSKQLCVESLTNNVHFVWRKAKRNHDSFRTEISCNIADAIQFGSNVCLVGYSLHKIGFAESKIQFLFGMGYSLAVTASHHLGDDAGEDVKEDDEDDDESITSEDAVDVRSDVTTSDTHSGVLVLSVATEAFGNENVAQSVGALLDISSDDMPVIDISLDTRLHPPRHGQATAPIVNVRFELKDVDGNDQKPGTPRIPRPPRENKQREDADDSDIEGGSSTVSSIAPELVERSRIPSKDSSHSDTRRIDAESDEASSTLFSARSASTSNSVEPTENTQQQPQKIDRTTSHQNVAKQDSEQRKLPARKPSRSQSAGVLVLPLSRSNLNVVRAGETMSMTKDRLLQGPTWEPVQMFEFPIAQLKVKAHIRHDYQLSEFGNLDHIADGTNSSVFSADHPILGTVVIKQINESVEDMTLAHHEFDVEHGLLSRVSHPNIIRILGAGCVPTRFLVLEHLSGGLLGDIMSKNVRSGFGQTFFHKSTFSFPMMLQHGRDLAQALRYLHFGCHGGATIIHRDLKPDNIGFAADGSIKLFDFGLGKCVRTRAALSQAYAMTGTIGSLRYMAPEVARQEPYAEKTDVYSFGIILWQMAKDKVPYHGLNAEQFRKHVIYGSTRPKLDKSWPTGFSSLLTSCWEADYVRRPTFVTIVEILEELLSSAGNSKAPAAVKVSAVTSPAAGMNKSHLPLAIPLHPNNRGNSSIPSPPK